MLAQASLKQRSDEAMRMKILSV